MKKIISALLTATILLSSITCLTFSAEEVSLKDKFIELNDYTDYFLENFNIYHFEDGDPLPPVGDFFVAITAETADKLNSDCDAAYELKKRYYTNKEDVTIEEVDSLLNTIEADLENVCVERYELEFMLALVDKENTNNYYDEATWAEFESVVSRANELLADENTSDSDITAAYWDLRFKFNEMCAYNQVMGDVDGDGDVTILDATLLQRALAEYVELNCSQVFVASVCCNPAPVYININCVTAIQRYCAEYDDAFGNYNRPEDLSDYLYSTELGGNFKNQMYKIALALRMSGQFWN